MNIIISKINIFNEKYRNDPYIIDEYLDDFLYYENTPLEQIEFDDKHSLPWGFFSLEGLNYLLPRVVYLIQTEIETLSVSLLDFMINMNIDDTLILFIKQLNNSDLSMLENLIEHILFETNDTIVNSIGEHYLFLDLEFIQALKGNK